MSEPKSKRILVVDNDAMYLRMAEYILKQNSYEVVLASSGYEGIGKIQNEDIDLVLLYIEMPNLSGMETLEKIRMFSEYKDLPVIFLTASGDKKDVVHAGTLGAVGYVRKPFEPEELLSRVAKVFE